MQDPTPHQTDIDSVIHQDASGGAPSHVAVSESGAANGSGAGNSNGNGAANGGKGRANGNGKAVVRAAEDLSAKTVRPTDAPGLTVERRFTKAGEDVYSTVEWELRDAVISNERGEKVFEQIGVEIPKSWTQLATNVVVSKYFRGHIGTPEREYSVRQLISRVADTMANWGRAMQYFATETDAQAFQDELTHILLHQKAAFNSPVWFNVGLPDQPVPQVSACFINSVDDTMASILTLAKTEGMLFKFGSGTGTNFSSIRGSSEKLNGGGTASGPVSFMRGLDQFAGAVKCLTPDAYVHTERGMQTLGEIIDPNLEPGFHADASVTLATKDGPARISHVYVSPEAETFRLRLRHTGLELRGTGEHPVLTLTPEFQLVWKRLTEIQPGERIAVARRAEMWPAESPSFADFAAETKWAKKTLSYPANLTPELARLLGYMVSEGCMDDERFRFCNADEDVFNDFIHCVQATFGIDPVCNISRRVHPKTGVTTLMFEACWTNAVKFLKHVGLTTALSAEKTIPLCIRHAPRVLVAEFLRAYFEGDGHISINIYVSSASKKLLGEVQLLLQNMGMISALRPHPVNGKLYWNLLLRGEEAWIFNREIGFISERKRNAAQFPGDKNTNVDTVPFLADVLRTRVQGVRYLKCADGVNRDLNFGFFNRRPGAGISYALLRSAPGLVEKVRLVNPEWGAALETILAGEFFWDTAASVEAAAPAVTYDFTVPGTHSFIANGIVNHNSGGKTRRAAKMAIIDIDHPDVEEFILCKAKEEKKAWALIDAGYSGAFNVPGGAYDSVLFQNANNSVRVTDDFMRAYERDEDFSTKFVTTGKPAATYKARDLMQKIGESAWICGDPGMQYDTTINKWHTCKNTDKIYGSNPCCVTGDTLVAVADGRNAVAIRDLVGSEVPVFAHNHATGRTTVSRMWNIGVKRENAPIYRVTLDDGSSFRATDDHLIMQRDGSYRMVRELKAGDSLMPFHSNVDAAKQNIREKSAHRWASSEERARSGAAIKAALEKAKAEGRPVGRTKNERHERCCPVCRLAFATPRIEQIFCGNECRYSPMGRQMSGEKTATQISPRNTILKAARLLMDNGVAPSMESWNEVKAQAEAFGASHFPSAATVARHFESDAALREEAALYNHKVVSVEFCGNEDVFDGTVDTHHNFAILTSEDGACVPGETNYSGIFIHNSEYMFLNDSACNLASLNLMKFRHADGEFDVEAFKHASRILITAQEIIVDNASYPTPRIGENSRDYRPLGLGYANLGALLMARGLAYDSDEGRAYAGAITALMTGEAYHQSAIIARDHGWPFPGYAKNREPFLEVMQMHRDAVETINPEFVPDDMITSARKAWDDALATGTNHGYRNAQSTVLAPTGCLVGDSLVLTGRGLVRLRSLGDTEGAKWQPLDVEVATDEGPRQAAQFYVNGAEPVVTVETGRGYRIQGTPTHRVKVVTAAGDWEWKRFADIRPGDRVPLMRGGLVGSPNKVPLLPLPEAYWTSDYTTFVPREMNADLAEFVGYFMGDGSLHSKGLRLCVSSDDQDVTARLAELGKSLFGLPAAITAQQGYTEVAFHSVRLTLWWEACGFAKFAPTAEHSGKGYTANIPDSILHANDPQVYAAFIRGLFEADGTVCGGFVSWTTTTERFSRDVQTLLLALGFVTTRKVETDSPGHWGKNPLHVLRLLNVSTASRFGEEIGFISSRKQDLTRTGDHRQAARHDHIPVSREMVDALAPINDSLRKTMLMSLARSGTVSRRSAEELLARGNHPKLGHLLGFFYDEVETAELGEEQFTYDLSVPENVTYVANGFVSHNTIGFLMDCDTTGIEPDIAIVKYKSLVGGGVLKIVNGTAPEALRKLGYTPRQQDEIIAYIEKNDTIEGAPELKPEHLSVFDCAFKPANGERSIHYMGHVKMMAAAQPFISGAISKCVTKDTLIFTDQGIAPIGSFYDGEKPGNFTPCNLTLASFDAPQKADLFYYGGVRPTLRLTLADGRTIEGTPNHRVKVANAAGYDWKRLDEIDENDSVAFRLGAEMWAKENVSLHFKPAAMYGNQKTVQLPAQMSPELGRFLGYYISEGNMTRTNWMVRITNNNPEVLRRCQETVCNLFGIGGRIETDLRNGVGSFIVASKTLVEFMDYLGCEGKSGEKQIPWSVLQSTREVVQEFIGGLWLDGYIAPNGMTAICLNSKTLIQQLQVVMNNFGIRAQVIRKYNKEYNKYFHELGMHGNDVRRFAATFTLDDPHKTERLAQVCAKAKKINAVHSDKVPCFRENIRQAILAARDTMQWRHVFDKRTGSLSWQTVRDVYAKFALPELTEIVENNIHFAQVRQIEGNFAEVYDFQVPANHAFLGNGIVNHNTVNMPHEATAEEIEQVYLEGWKIGLKAIAIYRDGSKRTQPLQTKKFEDDSKTEAVQPVAAEIQTAPQAAALPVAAAKPLRRKLPDERHSITHKFSIAGHEGYITVGMYEDGTPGEIFLTMSKEGSTISGLMDSFATAISLALQYGVPIQTLVDKFAHARFEPAGYTNNPNIRIAKSITDYIFRWLGSKFLTSEPKTEPSLSNGHTEEAGETKGVGLPPFRGNLPTLTLTANSNDAAQIGSLTAHEHETFQNQADAPVCTECGSLMVRNGACYKCLNCGSVFGCS